MSNRPRISAPQMSCPTKEIANPLRASGVEPMTCTLEQGTLRLEGEITRTRLPFNLNETYRLPSGPRASAQGKLPPKPQPPPSPRTSTVALTSPCPESPSG